MDQSIGLRSKTQNFTHMICKHNSLKAIFAGTLLFAISASYGTAQLDDQGVETKVNTTTAHAQIEPAIGVDTAGNYTVVWSSYLNDGEDMGIFAQRYFKGGTPNGAEFKVNSTTTGSQRHPDVALDAEGEIHFVYQSNYQGQYRVCLHKRNAAGSVQINQAQINSGDGNDHTNPKIAVNQGGDFIIVWTANGTDGDGLGVYGEMYSGSLVTVKNQFAISSTSAGDQSYPSVARDSSGSVVVVWQQSDGNGNGVFAKLLNDDGDEVKADFLVNTTTSGNQQEPDVAMDRNGNFLVVWSSFNQDGDHYGIYGQLYNKNGNKVGSEFKINSTTNNAQDKVAVAVSKNGGFVVSWTGYSNDGKKSEVYAQQVSASGVLQADEVRVNTRTADYQQFSDIALYSEAHEAVVVWQDGLRNSTSTNDGDDYGVYMQRFSVVDTTPPTVVCQNISVYLDGSGNATITAADIDNGSFDNEGIVSYSINRSSFTCSDIGLNVVQLEVADADGNQVFCNAAVTVRDTTRPNTNCLNLTVYLDGSGNASILPADMDNGTTDNCGISGIAISKSSFDCADLGDNSITFTATDVHGNVGTCIGTVTVEDTSKPSALCQNMTVYLNSVGSATITAGDLDNGSSDNCGFPSLSISRSAFTCDDLGANSVTLTARDAGGNISTCTSTVTVLDSTSPKAFCQNITAFLDASGNATITASDLDNGSSDNCLVPSLAISKSNFDCSNIGANSVTLSVTDASSNVATCQSTLTIVDSTSPNVVCQNTTVYLDASGNAGITIGDINNGTADNCGIASLSLSKSSFTCSDIGVSTVKLTATDVNGNSGSCQANVTVIDSIAPMVICQNITGYLDALGLFQISTTDIDNGSSDNCGMPNLSLSKSQFGCADVGINQVVLTATDASGNKDSCIATITIVDTTAPTAVCRDITVQLWNGSLVVMGPEDIDGGSIDNCGLPTLSASQLSFGCSDLGINNVTLMATDASGNVDSCVAVVTVVDATAPKAVCKDVIVVLDSNGLADILASDLDNGSTDNCQVGSLAINKSSFSCADVGNNQVVLTVFDASGLQDSCTATVTVKDTIKPVAICKNITLQLDANGNAAIVPSDIDGGSADNCGVVTLSASQLGFDCSHLGVNNFTLTVSDKSGNVDSCNAVVTVEDNLAPTAICKNVTVHLDSVGTASIVVADVDNDSYDNCTVDSLQISQANFTCAHLGQNPIVLTVLDASGNLDSCISLVTVLDTVSPNVLCKDVVLSLDSAGTASIQVSDLDNGSSDNCGIGSMKVDKSNFDCSNVGSNLVTFRVADVSGNTASCQATVTIMEAITPVVNCQNVGVYLDASGNATIAESDIDNGSFDNCGLDAVLISQSVFGCSDVGLNNVTLTVRDKSGNLDSCTAVVTVYDTVAPIAQCNDLTLYLDATGPVVISAQEVNKNSSDNCAVDSLGIDRSSFTCFDLGQNQAVLTVKDNSGNINQCASIITVVDTILPTILNCPTDITAQVNNIGCSALVNWVVPYVSDNCGVGFKSNFNPGDAFPLGVTEVVYLAIDSSGNSDSCKFTVTVTNDFALALDSATDVSCFGLEDGQVSVSNVGGNSPIVFDWNNDGIGDNDDSKDATFSAGTWQLVATDNTGCKDSLEVQIEEPEEIVLSLVAAADPLCDSANGAIDIAVSPDGPSYVFDWDYDGTGLFDDSEDLTGLAAGVYSVEVQDTNGCSAELQVALNNPNGPEISVVGDMLNCYGDSDGSINLTILADSDYTVDWHFDGTGDNDDLEDPTGLTAGAYDVTVIDSLGCQSTKTAMIDSPDPITATATAFSPTCEGGANGQVVVTSVGGSGGHLILWNDGDSVFTKDSLSAGEYVYTITDSNACSITDTVEVEDSHFSAQVNVTNVQCHRDYSGHISVIPSGGVPAFSIVWESGQSTMDLDSLIGGIYSFTITDGLGCSYSSSVTVIEPPELVVAGNSSPEVGGSDGSIDLMVTGGTPGYVFDWDTDGAGDYDDPEDLTGLTGGAYTVSVKDSNGCVEMFTVDVETQVGVISADGGVQVGLFPNPNDGNFTIKLVGFGSESVTLKIVDAIGKQVFVQSVKGRGSVQMDLEALRAGKYFVHVRSVSHSVFRLLIIY